MVKKLLIYMVTVCCPDLIVMQIDQSRTAYSCLNKFRIRQYILIPIVIIFLSLFSYTSVAVEQKPVCAVLTFNAGEGIKSWQTSMLCNKFAISVGKTGTYHVLSRYLMNRILSSRKFDPEGYRSITRSSLDAGRILNAQYIIAGIIEKDGEEFILSTFIMDIRASKVVKRVKTYYTGDFDSFLRIAVQRNIKSLLNLASSAQLDKKTVTKKLEPNFITPTQQMRKEPLKKLIYTNKMETPVKESAIKRSTIWTDFSTSMNLPELTVKAKEFSADRIEVGSRITHFILLNDTKKHFLGSIDYLKSRQDYPGTDTPIFLLPPYMGKVFINYLFTPTWGIELTWDRLKASAITTEDGHSDGDIVLKGSILTVFYRYPVNINIRGRQTPLNAYAGFGIAKFNSRFNHNGWWHNGFNGETEAEVISAYDEWVASGSPEWPNNGYQRTMNLNDPVGFVLTAGCSMTIQTRLSLDLYLRYMNIEVDDNYTLSSYGDVFQSRKATFPMSNIAMGIGMKYSF